MSTSRQIRRRIAKSGATQLDRVFTAVDKIQKTQSSLEGITDFVSTLQTYQESVAQNQERLLERVEALEKSLYLLASCEGIPLEVRGMIRNMLKVK